MIKNGEENNKKNTRTILVVDDDEELLKMLCEVLQCEGYAVVSASDGQSGWDTYKEAKPDLVILDIRMSGIDGLTLLSCIRKEDTLIPVVVMTGYIKEWTEMQAFKLGADGFFPKPFRIELIYDTVNDLLNCNSLELQNRRLNRLVSLLSEENKRLKENAQKPCKKIEGKTVVKDKYRDICGSVAHSLKGEFVHIDNSIKNLRELEGVSLDIQEEYDWSEPLLLDRLG